MRVLCIFLPKGNEKMKISKNFVTAGKEYTTYANAVAAPLFKLCFDYNKSGESPFLEISALGFYDAYINGVKITKGMLAPYISNPEHYAYYDRYELSDILKEGKNVLCVLLANGFVNDHGGQIWDFDKASFRAAPALSFCLFDGEKYHEAADCRWKRSALLYDDYRCGVVYDARLFKNEDLTDTDTDGEEWHTPDAIDEGRIIGELTLCRAEPIRVREEITAVSVKEGNIREYFPRRDVYKGDVYLEGDDFEGGYVLDYGKITAGSARIKVKGDCGQRISLRFAELTDENGDLDINNINFQPPGYVQRAVYFCRGGEEEVFEIPFTYYGCRYCHVHGLRAEQVKADTVTLLSASSDIEEYLDFECSDETVNKIFELCRRSDLDNFYYFPTDCPQREKNGWTGDASESCEHMLLRYGAANSLDTWMDNILKAQAENGSLPGIVPTGGWGFKWGNGPAWDRALFNIPYAIYKYTGSTATAEKCVEAMYRYLRYANSRRNEQGTLEIGLGDYCQAGRNPSHPTTPIEFTDSAVLFDIAKKASFLFGICKASAEYSEYADTLASSMREAIRKRFLDVSDMSLAGGTQTAQSFGLSYGIFEESEIPLAAKRLVEEVKRDGGLMNVGFLGSKEVFHALSNNGYSALAFSMIMNKATPSYANIVERGFTALPERFDTATVKEKYPSFNHHFYGDVSRWIVYNILGMQVNPDMDDENSVLVTPRLFDGVTSARGKRKMPDGEVEIGFTVAGSKMTLKVKESGSSKIYYDFSNATAVRGIDEHTFEIEFDNYPKGEKQMKKYVDLAVSSAGRLIGIDSPGSYTAKAVEFLKAEFEACGCKATVTNKGGLVVDMGGRDADNALLIEAHTDTLGAVVSEIKGNGRLKLSPIGGLNPNNIECEDCRVITKFDGEYEGTFQLSNASVHVNRDYTDAKRSYASMEVVLDEDTRSAKETRALGISVGDIVVFNPRFRVTEKGYIKSRFLDDKLSVGIILALARYINDNNIVLDRRTYAHITVYEEVGHGGAASVPAGVTEGLAIDMGCVGDGLECTEKEVSICAKDSGGPYNYEMTKALIGHAKRLGLGYAVDVYPFYGSDVEATLRGGNDIRHALIGPGVYASHGYERSHVEGIENTLKLTMAYVGIL